MGRIKVYTTVLDHADQQEYYETALIPEIKPIEMNVVNVYMDKKYQKIEGFGGALTEAAGYALSQMDNKYQKEILEAYYGKNGIGYTLGRVSMDSCDFALGNYCADDDPLDEKFTKFSLERDQKYVEPILKKINEIAQQQVQLLLSPWSPPAYMKTTKVRNGGGKLRKEYYQRYADYIAKYITEYHNRGFLITQMTIQNEPFAVQLWDSCEYSPMEEKDFLQNYLFPTLKEKGLEHIKIYIWDHNKERVYERTRELMDKDTAKMITGVAYH